MADREDLFEGLQTFLQSLFNLADGLGKMAELDLSLTQVRTLLLLTGADQPLPVNGVADQLGLSVPAACRNIDRLVRLGGLERRESPEDRRVKLVSITAGGLEMVAHHLEPRNTALRTFIDRLPDEDVDDLAAVLDRVLAGNYLSPTVRPDPTHSGSPSCPADAPAPPAAHADPASEPNTHESRGSR